MQAPLYAKFPWSSGWMNLSTDFKATRSVAVFCSFAVLVYCMHCFLKWTVSRSQAPLDSGGERAENTGVRKSDAWEQIRLMSRTNEVVAIYK